MTSAIVRGCAIAYETGMRARRFAILYLAFPMALAVFLGMRGSVWFPHLSVAQAIALFAAFHLPIYLFAAVVSHAALGVMRRLAWPPAIALVLGALATIAFGYVFVSASMQVMDAIFPGLSEARQDGREAWGGFVASLTAPDSLMFVPIWIGLHFVYEWGSRDSVYFRRFAPRASLEAKPAESQGAQVFWNRIPSHLRSSLLAIEADKHYVVIHASAGEGRLLHRFGDAVAELEAAGLGRRVHRSWWVANDAVAALEADGKTLRLRLTNGLLIPVSRANGGSAKKQWGEGPSHTPPPDAAARV